MSSAPSSETARPGPSPEPRERDASRIDPPSRRLVRAVVTDEVLDVAEHAASVADRSAGATVTFAGVVRDHDHGRQVLSLEYSAHPTAGRVVEEVARDVLVAHPVDALAVSHRTGPLGVGEVALAVAVAAAHRREAFEAAEMLVEEVKARVPIWKRQHLADGSQEWVACP